MKPIVSVIIPAYNVEEFLPRCLDSVINQTLNNIEIILVDDGSPDRSPEICDEYAKKDNRIKVIHKPNGGLSSARNAGMKEAQGEYLFFVDSDDWLELDGIEMLYNTAIKYDVDFVRYRAIRSGWPGLPKDAPCNVELVRELQEGLYDKERINKEVLPRLLATSQLSMGAIVGACGSLYKTSLLLDNKIFFYEDVKYSEDMIFSANVVKHTNSFYFIDTPCVYHYFYNSNSISKSFRKDRWDACKNLMKYLKRDFINQDLYDFSDEINYACWFCILLALNERIHLSSYSEKKEYCKSIMEEDVVRDLPLYLKKYDISFKLKCLMFFIKHNCYRLVAMI